MTKAIRLRNTFIATILAATLAGVGVVAQGSVKPPSPAQAVGTLSIDTISPSATPVYAVSFSVANSATDPGGGGGGAGKATFSEFRVARLPDAASPLIFKAAATGIHIKEVQIDVLRAGSNSVDSSYLLSDVLVSSFSTDASFEHVSFTYQKIEVASGGVRTCWNVASNASC